MENQKVLTGRASGWRNTLRGLTASIGAKIVLPYLVLTLAVAGIGAYVVTNLVTSSMREQFNNQLLDAGRVVSESIVRDEEKRLEILRAVAGTEGVPESLRAGEQDALDNLVPQILANSNAAAVELLDMDGIEVYGWQRPPDRNTQDAETRTGADFSSLEDVRLVLDDHQDDYGEKRAFLAETPYGMMVFSVGPVDHGGGPVGAVMVGTYLSELVTDLTESAVAKVTLYDQDGGVYSTTLGGGQESVAGALQVPSDQYKTVIDQLQETPNRYRVVVAKAEDQVQLKQVDVLGQQYGLAFGDWRLRGQSFGLFSVSLPSNFIVSTAAISRDLLSLIFSLMTVGVITVGFLIARRIIKPLNRLVVTSEAVAGGDLAQRTGIQRKDEIGSLASSFDVMTQKLAERNRQLMEQASKLEAILNSIADGVVVLDMEGQVITANPAAQLVLAEMSSNSDSAPVRKPPSAMLAADTEELPRMDQLPAPAMLQQSRRYQVGGRVLSALAAPVVAPDGEELGAVVVLRDITREVESERLKDEFITNISHELRTPLTAIKGFSDLLIMTADGSLDERRLGFVETIGENANQLLYHINKLIDISQIQAKSLGLERDRVSLSELVEELVENWREPMEGKELSLRVRLSGGSLWVDGDRHRLTWAVENLLSNASNYTLPGGSVEVRTFQDENQARVDVTDTGVGISDADQAYLFTRFFRAHDEDAFGVRGVGLGLYITRSIVELHNGRVWADSKLGAGSTFSIALPLQGASDD